MKEKPLAPSFLDDAIRKGRMAYWLLMVIIVAPIAYLLIAWPLLPLLYLAPSLHKVIENFLCVWLNRLFGVLASNSGFDVFEYGADVSSLATKRCLVMVNHQTHADHFPLLQAFCKKPGGHGSPIWLIYKFPLLRWCPLGLCWAMHGNFFVQVGRTQVEIARLRQHMEEVYFKRNMDWVVLYPEGATLPKYLKKSQDFARANGFPHLQHSALPRTAAVTTILETNKEAKQIEYIIDATMAWEAGKTPLIGDMFLGLRGRLRTHMLYRVYRTADLRLDSEEAIRAWLYDRWAEKDQLLDDFYKTGVFAAAFQENRERPVEYGLVECLGVQLFWIALLSLQLFSFCKLACLFC